MTALGIFQAQGALASISFSRASYRQPPCAELGSLSGGLRGGFCLSRGLCKLRGDKLLTTRQWRGVSHSRVLNPLAVASVGEDGGTVSTSNESTVEAVQGKVNSKRPEVRKKVRTFLESKSGFSWLLGPAVATVMIVFPAASLNLALFYEKNYFGALAATFGLDVLFVIAADVFLLLAERFGQHQKLGGASVPLAGPSESIGYPKGFPDLLNLVSYASVGVGITAIFASVLVAKLPAAMAVFGPYLALIFSQVVYERLLGDDRLPVFPLVPILYTVYRFRQLSRGLALLPFIANGSPILTRFVHLSSALWALYLGMYLTQLPWLYSSWNSKPAT